MARMCAEERNDFTLYGALNHPTLILRGERTRHVSIMRGIDQLLATLPDVVERRLEGQGHHALLQAPDLVARELEAFVDGVTA